MLCYYKKGNFGNKIINMMKLVWWQAALIALAAFFLTTPDITRLFRIMFAVAPMREDLSSSVGWAGYLTSIILANSILVLLVRTTKRDRSYAFGLFWLVIIGWNAYLS